MHLMKFNIDSFLRACRAAIGTFILVVIVTSILIPQILAVTGNSVVNAKLEWIRTPINGNVSYSNLKPGDSVKKGDLLGEIVNERADDSFLNSLQFEKSQIDSDLFKLNNRHEQLNLKKIQLEKSVSDALDQLKEQTSIRINTIETEIKLASGKITEIDLQISRYQKVNKEFSTSEPYSVVSRESIDEQKLLKTEIEAYISNQKDSLQMLKADSDSTINGTFTGKNTPPEQRQLKEIDQQIGTVLSEKEALNFRIEKISKDIDERLEKLSLNKHHKFTSRVNGIVWDIGYADGSYVNNGDSLVAIANLDTLTIECIFHQRYLDNIKIGDFATVDLMGSNQKLTGRVSQVMIQNSKSSDLKAFTSNNPQTNEFKVTVTLDDNSSQPPKLGQRAKVVITKRKTSTVPGILLFLSQ